MSVMEERIETAFEDELLRMKHDGVGKLLALPLDLLLYQVYRRGYIRGHSARSREVQQQEEQDRREGKFPMNVELRYEGDRLIIDGKDLDASADGAGLVTALLGAAMVLAAWCGDTRVTGYSRYEYGPYTADGTDILTPEAIAAASWDVRMGSLADIPGVGTVRIADRGGGLGNGHPLPWVDVAVWSRAEAFSLTSVRRVCFRRPPP